MKTFLTMVFETMAKWNWLAIFGLVLFAVVVLWYPPKERLDALAAYVWPVAVVVCCMIFREPLARAVDRLKEVGPGGAKFNNSGVGAPVVTAAESSTATVIGSIPFSAPARKLLATLGFYQVKHFPDGDKTSRWWMVVPAGSADWAEYIKGVGDLLTAKLIVVAPPQGTTFLTEEGLAFYRKHQAELEEEPRYEKFGPAA